MCDYVPIARLSQICRLETLIPWLAFCRHYTYFSSLPKYLNVATRLAGNIISPSVTWNTDKPLILIHFRKATVSTNVINRDGLMSLWDFQKKLRELGHFYTENESIEGLQKHFYDQLDELRAKDLL